MDIKNIIKECIDKVLNEKKQGLKSKILFDLIQKYGKPYMSDVDLHLLTDDEILHVSYESASNKHLQTLKKEFNTHQFICGRGYIVVVKYDKDKDETYNKKIGDRYNERYAKIDGAKEYKWHNKEAQDLVFRNPYFRKEWDKDIQKRAIDNIRNKRNFYNGFEKIKKSKK